MQKKNHKCNPNPTRNSASKREIFFGYPMQVSLNILCWVSPREVVKNTEKTVYAINCISAFSLPIYTESDT